MKRYLFKDSPLGIQQTYSNEFSIYRSTAKTPLLMLGEAVPLYFLNVLHVLTSLTLEIDFLFRKQGKSARRSSGRVRTVLYLHSSMFYQKLPVKMSKNWFLF